MDTHSNLTVPNRSRSSQSPSPSHSASASATSSIHKRKLAAAASAASEDRAPPFPPSSFSADTRDGALTSNDDLESISARGADSDSDADDSDAVVDDDEDEFDNDSSMHMFTAARLETNAGSLAASAGSDGGGGSSARNTKLKMANSTVKIEKSDSGKDERATGNVTLGSTTAGSSAAGIGAKEDAVKIFTENLQTSGAYSAREESLKREVRFWDMNFGNFCESSFLAVE